MQRSRRGLLVIICAAGDIHGAVDRLYADVLAFEAVLGVRFEWVLHVGDFGIWPDSLRIDRATRNHEGAGDFPGWFAANRAVPRPTLFIKGNHEDFAWLDGHDGPEVLPGLFYLRNGWASELGPTPIRVGGVGGCFGPADFARQSKHLQGYARRHYTRDEIDRLAEQGKIDVLLLHDAPAGVQFAVHRRGKGYVSEAAGLDTLIARVRPRLCLFGHHHARIDAEIAGVRCLGLNKVGMPGNLVAVQLDDAGPGWSVIGEWPQRAAGGDR